MTLYGSISVLIWFSRIFGVFPFHITFRFLYLITLGYIFVFTTSLVSMSQKTSPLRQIAAGNYYRTNLVSNFGLLFHFICGSIVLYTIYICSLVKNNYVKKVLQSLNEVDETVKKMGLKFQYRRDKIFTTVVCFTGLITILLIVILQAPNIRREKLRPINLNTWFAFIFPLIVANVMATQFSFTVLAIYDRIKKVNVLLINVEKLDGKCVNSVVNKVVILMKLYDTICDMASQTNNNYMVQLFVTLANQYGVMLFSIFYCYWMVKQ